jgi:predicted protein tyrosine phosphatase
MIPDLFWIPGPWSGRLAIAARPRGGEWLDDEANGWRRAGLDVVVSLLEEEEAAQLELALEGQAAAANGVRFVSCPIPDRGVPASTQRAVALLKDIVGALEDSKNVAVHCRQSIGRSGLIAAGALVTALPKLTAPSELSCYRSFDPALLYVLMPSLICSTDPITSHCVTSSTALMDELLGEARFPRQRIWKCSQVGIPLTHRTPTCRFGLWRITREPSRSSRSGFRPRRTAEHTW